MLDDADPWTWNPRSIERVRGSVYHYTSSAGLLGIVSGGVIRASEASNLNDIAEIKQGWNFIRDWLGKQQRDEVIDRLLTIADRADRRTTPSETFVTSASMIEDDANQWRLYAQGGRGYAIELDASVPLAVLAQDGDATEREMSSSTPDVGTLLRDSVSVSPWLRVLYTTAAKEAAMQELVSWVRQLAEWVDESPPADEVAADERRDQYEGALWSALDKVAQLIKEPGFAGENEARLVVTFVWAGPHLLFRPGDYGIVRYAELAVVPAATGTRVARVGAAATTGLLPLKSVRLGPLLRPESNTASAKALLHRFGYKTAGVGTSGVPLR